MQLLQAYNLGEKASSLGAIVEALAKAKEAGINIADVMPLVNWDT
jgi:hypothetical protein